MQFYLCPNGLEQSQSALEGAFLLFVSISVLFGHVAPMVFSPGSWPHPLLQLALPISPFL